MKIYHYTSIETLALILKHKSIRFNRLDKMDDHFEKTFLLNQYNWSPYAYVSCWSENPVENIPLWHTYCPGGAGVRIALDQDFIDWDKQTIAISVPSQPSHHKLPSKDSSGAVSVTFNPIRIYRPLSDEDCYHHVTYANEDEYREYENTIGMESSNNEVEESIMRKYVGLFRKDKWAFQDESRFVIYAVPYTLTDAVVTHKDFVNLIKLNMPNNVPFIDVPIKHDKLNHIEVLLGPNVNEAQTILVKALLQKYAPESSLSVSTLSDSPIWLIHKL